MGIQWNKVTWYSKLAAVILGVIVLGLGFYIGEQYSFVKNQPAIVIGNINTNKKTPLFLAASTVFEISPDQKKVAYLTKENSETGSQELLYIANIDGTNKEILAKPTGNYAHGNIPHFFWNEDSKSVTYYDYQGDEGGSSYNLYKIIIDGKKKIKLDSGSN